KGKPLPRCKVSVERAPEHKHVVRARELAPRMMPRFDRTARQQALAWQLRVVGRGGCERASRRHHRLEGLAAGGALGNPMNGLRILASGIAARPGVGLTLP